LIHYARLAGPGGVYDAGKSGIGCSLLVEEIRDGLEEYALSVAFKCAVPCEFSS
jgi:hypothetical protein